MTRRPTLQIEASKRFLHSYQRAVFSLQGIVESAVHDFVRRHRANAATVLRSYDRIAGLHPPIIEIDVSGGHRLLASYSNHKLILLDMGGHEVVSRYTKNKPRTDLERHQSVPSQFFPGGGSKLFVDTPDRVTTGGFPAEVTPEWLYFLAKEQQLIFYKVALTVLDGSNQTHFIIGGPGTGKTSILLNLLKYFVDSELKVGIIMSDELTSYVERSTLSNISKYRVENRSFPSVNPLVEAEHSDSVNLFVEADHSDPLDLLLVDDPSDIRMTLQRARSNGIQSVVLAFDPLQLQEDLSDSFLERVVSEFGVNEHRLTACYRQKEKIGKATKRVLDNVAVSTPFLQRDKIQKFQEDRKDLTRWSNELVFLNPHGYVKHYPDATISDVKTELNRILQNRRQMWNHYPGLLVMVDDGISIDGPFDNALTQFRDMGYVKVISINEISQVKGLEFQHVFVFIKQSLFDDLEQGFKGTGQSLYRQRRLLRIPFSRAKDSLVTFAIE